jgi:hypothetical protein
MEVKKTEDFFDVSALIDERFGKKGTASRTQAEEKAYAFATDCLESNQRNKSN